jgi:hypothetical protein
MAEVISNHRNIDPCLQKGNGTTVSHDVWTYSALSYHGSFLCRDADVLAQEISNAVMR